MTIKDVVVLVESSCFCCDHKKMCCCFLLNHPVFVVTIKRCVVVLAASYVFCLAFFRLFAGHSQGQMQCLRALQYFILTIALQVFRGDLSVYPPPPPAWEDWFGLDAPSAKCLVPMPGSVMSPASRPELVQRLQHVVLMATNLVCYSSECFISPLKRPATVDLMTPSGESNAEDVMLVDTHETEEQQLASIPLVVAVLGIDLEGDKSFSQNYSAPWQTVCKD